MQIIEDFACSLCSCVCDDLRLSVENGRIVRAERACALAEPWLLSQDSVRPPAAEIEGRPVPVEEAVDRAVDLLGKARAPLIYGLSRSSTEGQRAAVRLAEFDRRDNRHDGLPRTRPSRDGRPAGGRIDVLAG